MPREPNIAAIRSFEMSETPAETPAEPDDDPEGLNCIHPKLRLTDLPGNWKDGCSLSFQWDADLKVPLEVEAQGFAYYGHGDTQHSPVMIGGITRTQAEALFHFLDFVLKLRRKEQP